jgi:hypothetical protein
MSGGLLQSGSLTNQLSSLSPAAHSQFWFKGRKLCVEPNAIFLIAASIDDGNDAAAVKIEC